MGLVDSIMSKVHFYEGGGEGVTKINLLLWICSKIGDPTNEAISESLGQCSRSIVDYTSVEILIRIKSSTYTEVIRITNI